MKQEILAPSRAENHRKQRKKKRKTMEYYNNPYTFAKKLFTAAKDVRLDIP